jgi:O-antigen ligase
LRSGAALLLTATWTALGVVLWAMFPMTAAVLLPLCCIAPLGWYWAQKRRVPWYRPSLAIIAHSFAATYLLINASWSRSPSDAMTAIVLVFVMITTLHIVLNTLPDLEAPAVRAMGVGVIAGLGVSGALLCSEVFNDQRLRLLLIRLVPALQPDARHLTMEGGYVAQLAPYLMNHSIGVVTLMFWPAALIAGRVGLLRAHKFMALLAVTLVTATVFVSEHATSAVALVGAGVTFALFRACSKLAVPLVIAGWVAANLLVLPVVSALYSAEAYRTPWLPYSARHRVVIWHYTSEQILKAPLFGVGIGTPRAQRDVAHAEAPVVPGTAFRLSAHGHSHNGYLQVWYETGAVGAFIFLGLGLVVLRAVAKLPTDVLPYLAATFSAGALMIATSFSVWAPWLMASLAMASIFGALGKSLPESTR